MSAILSAPWRWCKRHFFKLFIFLSVVIAAYLFYLDAQIQHRFEGNKWQVPAQIFARPLQLAVKQEITMQEVIDELTLLGYRKRSVVNTTGEFSKTARSITIGKRAFHFPEGYESAAMMTILWSGSKIANITSDTLKESAVDNNSNKGRITKARSSMRLEPWLVSRLTNGLDEDRMLMREQDIPDSLKNMLVLVEDRDFYRHHGIAPLSIIRALLANVAAGRTVQGGSTLTQQLVKNLFLTRERSYSRKLKEAIMAILIDARYSKDEILNAYINEVFLGQNGAIAVHGFGLASHFYFDRPLAELDINEQATLVGMIKGPSYYHPKRHPERALERRNLVLRLMFEANTFDQQAYETAVTQPLRLSGRESLASGKHPAYMEKVRNELGRVIAKPEKRLSGVKVFTGLDINAQRRAETALVDQTSLIAKRRKLKTLEAAMVITDIESGELRAIVGGTDTDYKGFNRALYASRPIGSLVKPPIFLAALEDPYHYNLATQIDDNPIKIEMRPGEYWEPKNADKTYKGQASILASLTHSLNIPSVNLGLAIGLDTVTDTIRRLGVKKYVNPVPAITLGVVELTPLEANQMYQTIANNGLYQPLHALNAVTSHKNELIWQYSADPIQRANAPATYLLNYALHKVTTEGTASQINRQFPNVNMAGKTGTTDDYRDSWFAGFDRNAVSTVWMGHDDNSPINLSGSSGALQVFIAYQQTSSPKSLVRRFPKGLDIAHFDKVTGELSAPGCGDIISVPAIMEALPANSYSCKPQRDNKREKKKSSWWKNIFG